MFRIINLADKQFSLEDLSVVSVFICASMTFILSSPIHPHPSPHTRLSSTATGHWPGPLQKQRSHKNYADVPDVNMTYFEALQRPADLVAVLPHWPSACICIHDLPSAHINQNHCFHLTKQVFSYLNNCCCYKQFTITFATLLCISSSF